MSQIRRVINLVVPVWDFAYILQLEEYELKRYWKQVRLRLFKRNFEQRDILRYTSRMKLTLIGFFALSAFVLLVAFSVTKELVLFAIALTPLTTPFLLGIVSFLVGIPTRLAAEQKLKKAAQAFKADYATTKIIGITGSFGKTTAKYMLQHVLQYDYGVAIIPDNINTALGVADHILTGKLPKQIDVLIVEMGAYTIGDIAQTAFITPPDYAVLTILGDQHLERFGSKANLLKGKSEIFTTNKKTVCYTTVESASLIKGEGISTDQLVSIAVPAGKKSTQHLVRKLAQDLKVSNESIAASLESFTPPDRRNNIIERQGVTIIDNSYNISPMVAEVMLKEAAATAVRLGKSLVVMTGGIGEQGTDEIQANVELANLLNQYASRVFINSTVFAEHMYSTLSVPTTCVEFRTELTDNPAQYLNGKEEILLWLTGHGDLAYV
ncbi:MAG: UDP-N-acetylmuramyl pentapeptide synthase [Candidatus Paceibacteria bacterium]|jgi:UDP-N-acetylmuramyl pentapeptide synthase